MEQLFGKTLAIDCTLCGYLSLIDIYAIISSNIFGNDWKEYFPSNKLRELYTNKESIKQRNDDLLLCSEEIGLKTFRGSLGMLRIITMKPYNFNLNNDETKRNKKREQNSSYFINKLRFCNIKLMSYNAENDEEFDQTELVKYIENYNKERSRIYDLLSKNKIKSIEAMLGVLFLTTIYDKDEEKYCIDYPFGIKLLSFNDSEHSILEQQFNKRVMNLNNNEILINYWTNFCFFFKHQNINKFNLEIVDWSECDETESEPAQWSFKYTINNYESFDQLIENEPFKEQSISKYLKYKLFMPGIITMGKWYSITVLKGVVLDYVCGEQHWKRIIIAEIYHDKKKNNNKEFLIWDISGSQQYEESDDDESDDIMI
eukprot:78426_1